MNIPDSVVAKPDKHIFLSPHYDDVPLSCGGTVAKLAASGKSCRVLIVFGDAPRKNAKLTRLAKDLHSKWNLTAGEVIDRRQKEEQVAASTLGYEFQTLPFSDAIYRGSNYRGDDELFGDVTFDELDLPDSIVERMPVGMSQMQASRIYAPLGIGNHVDHQIVYHAGLALVNSGHEVWFYEDMPYALDPARVEARLTSIRGMVDSLGTVDITSRWEQKIDAIMSYSSQLGVIFGDYAGVDVTRASIDRAMGAYNGNPGSSQHVESFWHSKQAAIERV